MINFSDGTGRDTERWFWLVIVRTRKKCDLHLNQCSRMFDNFRESHKMDPSFSTPAASTTFL